ncbi:MAG: ATP-binding cassette domain-containing protein [Chloroflexi bacterium]|nr:ATP-binding cassette domain-containing protein [Chloroflexota bacterium]MBT5628195.1 ATP-binding cassette domain-containing protein [Chloroflexota bacterium]
MTYALEIDGLTKRFGDKTVVDDVSFSVQNGEVFGFLGPNGSGKTTTIRTALGILHQDAGEIRLLDGLTASQAMPRVGYLPEERGLLRKEKVSNILRYLGRLRGLEKAEAYDRGLELLHRVGLYEHRDKKVEGLSRGMTQLVQFVASLIHHPELIILDEPFSGLDPLNVQLMKEMLAAEQKRGATIIFSTHVMSDVEEMCEQVALIADSRLLLFGELAEIRRSRGANAVVVEAPEHPNTLPAAQKHAGKGGQVEYRLSDELKPEMILDAYSSAGIVLTRFEQVMPSLNDIFIEEVSNVRQNR